MQVCDRVEIAEAVSARLGRCTPDDWRAAFSTVAREYRVTVARAEACYDEMYRQYLADRGLDQ